MARKSVAALSVVGAVGIDQRPAPPSELEDEEAHVWQGVVDRMPATWFSKETFPLLVQYCRHTVTARRVAQMIRQCLADDDFDVELYDTLLKMQGRETRDLSSVATKMRLTQQSVTTDRTAGTAKKKAGLKPWTIDAT